jgi:tRNA pseudouridine55 synthase
VSSQRPPAFSAVKVGGRPLHRAARAGEHVEAPSREIRVHAFELLALEDGRDFGFRVACSSGTYVRVLVADVGAALGCGAHLVRLVRTRVGPFELRDAVALDDPGPPLPLERAVAHLPRVVLSDEEAAAAGHGRLLAPAGLEGPYGVYAPNGRLVAMYRDEGPRAKPEMVLARSS